MKQFKVKRWVYFFLNSSLVLVTFFRFLFAQDSISYDYQFYIFFIKEISSLDLNGFFSRVIEGFPYFRWADHGKFEFGFAFFVYPFSLFFDSEVVYALIASLSIFVKVEILRSFGLGFYRLFIFYLFDIILFESNMMRAGIALSFVLLSCWLYFKRESVFFALFFAILAGSFHLSSYAFLALGVVAYFIQNIKLGRTGIGLLIFLSIIFAGNLEFVFEVVGGKLSEYLIQAKEFDLYTGASGLNASSFLCFLFAVYFWNLIFLSNVNLKEKTLLSFYYAEVISISFGVLILFSGFLSILGDRFFQMGLPVLLALIGFSQGKGGRFLLSGWFVNIFNFSVNFLLFYYVVIGLLFRYPLTNFFSWITGVIEFTPPAVM